MASNGIIARKGLNDTDTFFFTNVHILMCGAHACVHVLHVHNCLVGFNSMFTKYMLIPWKQ